MDGIGVEIKRVIQLKGHIMHELMSKICLLIIIKQQENMMLQLIMKLFTHIEQLKKLKKVLIIF